MATLDLDVYGRLARSPGVVRLVVGSLLARVPAISLAIPLSFYVKDATGSFGWAGVVAAVYSVGVALGAPVWGRRADRADPRRVLALTGVLWAAGVLVVALLPVSATRLLPLVAGVAGFFSPPVASVTRASWPSLLDGDELATAYTVDATSTELAFMLGPVLGAMAVSLVNPRAGLLMAAAMSVLVVVWFALTGPVSRTAPTVAEGGAQGQRTSTLALLAHRYRGAIVLAFGVTVGCFSMMSLAIAAYAEHRGDRMLAGVLELAWAGGSLTGGIVAGALPVRTPQRVWPRAVLLAAGAALCAGATGWLLLFAVALFAAGLFIAPTAGLLYERAGALTPQAVRTEMFGWMSAAAMAGGAAGSAVAGLLIDASGVRSTFLAAAAVLAGAVLLTLHLPPQLPTITGTPGRDALEATGAANEGSLAI